MSLRPDQAELTPDMLIQKLPGTEFVDNAKNFSSGVAITKDMVGSAQAAELGDYENRLYAAKAGINGAWYNWFGQFGGSGNMPNFRKIADVYARLKLIRVLPGWDNMSGVPLALRSWDGTESRSTRSLASPDVIYSRHWKTGKLFVVFLTHKGVVQLGAKESVASLQHADGLLRESGDASSDLVVSGNQVRLGESVAIDTDPSNGQVKGNAYVITLH